MRYPLPVFWRIVLSPFSVIYQVVVWIRNWLYDIEVFPVHEFEVPVIAVGNLTVGGTGKTPHVEYLVKLLREHYGVAVLSRGYRRKTKGFLVAGPETSVEEIGDEPWQIHHKFPDVKVIVDEKRVRALRRIEQEMDDVQVVILDDAFQHRAVKPGISILLIEYDLPLAREFYLPAGRMRESRHEKKRADIVIFTKCPERLKPIEERIRVKQFNPFPYQQVYFTRLVYGELTPLFPQEGIRRPDPASFRRNHDTVIAVSGIANPAPFHKYLQQYTDRLRVATFPDHHPFRKKDLLHIGGLADRDHPEKNFYITTEKDAARLRALPQELFPQPERWFYLPVEVAVLQESEREEFENKILEYVKNNQRKRRLHQGSDR